MPCGLDIARCVLSDAVGSGPRGGQIDRYLWWVITVPLFLIAGRYVWRDDPEDYVCGLPPGSEIDARGGFGRYVSGALMRVDARTHPLRVIHRVYGIMMIVALPAYVGVYIWGEMESCAHHCASSFAICHFFFS
jgi:hypothetical protein